MAGVQPTTRRMLTEQRGIDLYQLKAEKGAPNGLATLGADGKVTAAQLPSGARIAVKATDTARASTTTLANDPELVLTGLTAGTYVLEMLLRWNSASALLSFRFGYGATTPATAFAEPTGPLGMFGVTTAGSAPGNTKTLTSITSPTGTTNGANVNVAMVTGLVQLTDPVFAFVWAQDVVGTATTLKAGSYLRLEKRA